MLVPAAMNFLHRVARLLGPGALLLIGIDRVNNRDTLLRAYNNSQGVTAAFNLNLLQRINSELGGSIPVSNFSHAARWNEPESRIEMHLEAIRDTDFDLMGRHFFLSKGETMHAENSLKYTVEGARELLRAGGWTPIGGWTDDKALFSVILARPEAGAGDSSLSEPERNSFSDEHISTC